MPEEVFKFKQFNINQELCAMKVGTDSVLLGALTAINKQVQSILDIGTGTGLLALILAQKSMAHIDAVEIDDMACTQANANFTSSIWTNRLHIHQGSLQNFKPEKNHLYDLIICNPPYFPISNNITILNEQRSVARHDKELPFEDLAYHVKRLLKPQGCLWLILPIAEGLIFTGIAGQHGIHLTKQIWVQPKPAKPPNRTVMCFSFTKSVAIIEIKFIIYNEDGSATKEYYETTKDYLLWKEIDG